MHGTWQVTVATILYVFEIVTFFVFLAITVARWAIYPHVAVRRALSDPDELGVYAISPGCFDDHSIFDRNAGQ